MIWENEILAQFLKHHPDMICFTLTRTEATHSGGADASRRENTAPGTVNLARRLRDRQEARYDHRSQRYCAIKSSSSLSPNLFLSREEQTQKSDRDRKLGQNEVNCA
jgi:hypothetical protein